MTGNWNWSTYTGEQAKQVTSALQILLDQNLLSGDEKEMAKSIQYKLRNACSKREGYTQVGFSDKENELLKNVEGSLWK